MSDWDPQYIQMVEIEYRSSEEIQTTITFYSEVRLSPVIYRVAQNGILKFCANSNHNNFLLGCLIQSRNISRRSKLNTEALRKIQTTITFCSAIRLSLVKYRNARNWMLKLWANSNDNNFLFGCLIESRSISRRSDLNAEALSKFKRQ